MRRFFKDVLYASHHVFYVPINCQLWCFNGSINQKQYHVTYNTQPWITSNKCWNIFCIFLFQNNLKTNMHHPLPWILEWFKRNKITTSAYGIHKIKCHREPRHFISWIGLLYPLDTNIAIDPFENHIIFQYYMDDWLLTDR